MQTITSARLARFLTATVLLSGAVVFGGCASIVHSGNRNISVNSEPAGAKVTISKASGEVVSHHVTPVVVALDPKRGFFKGQSYELTLELEGYQTRQIQLRPKLSGWYFGNILFGGVIGMLIVDPVTGSMWNLSPALINDKLSPAHAALIKSGNGILVVMTTQVSPEQLALAQRVN